MLYAIAVYERKENGELVPYRMAPPDDNSIWYSDPLSNFKSKSLKQIEAVLKETEASGQGEQKKLVTVADKPQIFYNNKIDKEHQYAKWDPETQRLRVIIAKKKLDTEQLLWLFLNIKNYENNPVPKTKEEKEAVAKDRQEKTKDKKAVEDVWTCLQDIIINPIGYQTRDRKLHNQAQVARELNVWLINTKNELYQRGQYIETLTQQGERLLMDEDEKVDVVEEYADKQTCCGGIIKETTNQASTMLNVGLRVLRR